MELTHEFRVGVPIERAWTTLLDVERIAPCMPGAQLEEVEGDEYRGVVKVKVGPITAQYKGKATIVERDEATHRAVVRAEGRDTRGQGNANATVTASLEADGDGTKVSIVTDLTITGRVAQLGRGVLADVSAKLLNEFVSCVETTVLGGDGAAGGDDAVGGDAGQTATAGSAQPTSAASAPSAPGTGTSGAGVRKIDQPAVQPIDLLGTAGTPVLKRAAPLLIVAIILFFFGRRAFRSSE